VLEKFANVKPENARYSNSSLRVIFYPSLVQQKQSLTGRYRMTVFAFGIKKSEINIEIIMKLFRLISSTLRKIIFYPRIESTQVSFSLTVW